MIQTVWMLAGLALCLAPLQEAEPESVARDALATLSSAIKDRDVRVIVASIGRLDDAYDGVSEKTQVSIRKGVGKVFDLKPRQGTGVEGWEERDELFGAYQPAVGLLFDKEDGGDVLATALKKKHFDEWFEVKAVLLEGLGYTKERKYLKVFFGYLDDESPEVASASASALEQYKDVDDEKLRFDIVETLIEAYWDHFRAAEREAKKGKEVEAQEYVERIEAAFDRTLNRFTRKDFGGPASWYGWWDEIGSKGEW